MIYHTVLTIVSYRAKGVLPARFYIKHMFFFFFFSLGTLDSKN